MVPFPNDLIRRRLQSLMITEKIFANFSTLPHVELDRASRHYAGSPPNQLPVVQRELAINNEQQTDKRRFRNAHFSVYWADSA